MNVALLILSVTLIACIFLNKISSKIGMPMIFVFILIGMFFGSDGFVKIHFENYAFAEKICSAALIFIMFYGGFGTKWSKARPVAGKAIAMSSLGVVLTAAFVGLFCRYALRIGWGESFLLGSVISSTDAASVFSILRSKRMNLKYNTASLLEIESGSNDPFSYMLTIVVLSVMNGSASGGHFAYMIFAQIVYGVGLGVVIALACGYLLPKITFATSGFDVIFVLAIAIFSYAFPTLLGGNGYLSVYIVGIVLGNRKLRDKTNIVHFFDGLTGLMQMTLFFVLGLLAFPSQLPKVALPALAVALFLTFIARPVVTALILGPFKCGKAQIALISWAGLRGAASIVFAVIAMINPAYMRYDIFHIVFFIVLFSILIQGSLLPVAARKLNMYDDEQDVMKTFTDYSDEHPIQFIQFTVDDAHPWAGSRVRDIVIPPDTIFALLQRGNQKIVPIGSTEIAPGDTLILCAKEMDKVEGLVLTERTLDEGDAWINQTVAAVSRDLDMLILIIQRDGKIIIPNGATALLQGDMLVMNDHF